jgi:hypothetical protein
MPGFVEVRHDEWIAAPIETVRAQFTDLDHHIAVNVHPKLRFEVLERGPRHARFVQHVKLLGLRQRDVFDRRIGDDGNFVDTSVEGFNRGGTLSFGFVPRSHDGRSGTDVSITIRLPVPPLIGGLVKPLLARQVRQELLAAVAQDKHDLEVRGYPAAAPRVATPSAAA